jgi:hypothetical protein
VNLGIAQAEAQSGQYISEYNIWMHHLVDSQGHRLFPPKMRLLSHWSLRDEIKASYVDASNGLAKQRMSQQVMELIITQTIPAVVVNSPAVDWNPFTNEVAPAAVDAAASPTAAAKPATGGNQIPDMQCCKNIFRGEESRPVFSNRAHPDRSPF